MCNQNWKVGCNDNRWLMSISVLFFFFYALSAGSWAKCFILFIRHQQKWIQSLSSFILTIRLFLLESSHSDHIHSLSDFVYSLLSTFKIEILFLSHFNNFNHRASSLSDVRGDW